MSFDFDTTVNRSNSNSIKWNRYKSDVLPLWVADMDFPAPEPILSSLHRTLEHGIIGYESLTKKLQELIAHRIGIRYKWQISPSSIVAVPGVVAGFTAAASTVYSPGKGVLIQPPVYPPFLSVYKTTNSLNQQARLCCMEGGRILHYQINWDVFQSAVDSNGGRTGLFLLCNPHNPIGHEYLPQDLLRLGSIISATDAILCADEIHAELLLGGTQHTPIASLDPQLASRTITLIAPSKTFNIPGLFCAFAIITNEELRKKYLKSVERMALHVNALGLIAAQAAYSGECDDWLHALLCYLKDNRDYLVGFINNEIPSLKTTNPSATYLAWIDCRAFIHSGLINGSPHKYFLKHAKVALSDGGEFGPGGEGFVRLNFGCPRSLLIEALDRMKSSLQ